MHAISRCRPVSHCTLLIGVAEALARTNPEAVDYPDPRGLTFTQLRDVLSTAFASPELLGASVVILNPNRDPTGGQAATQVTEPLTDALR